MSTATTSLFSASFEDPEIGALFTDEAWIRAMVLVEVTLANALAQTSVIPVAAAVAIADRAETYIPDYRRLAAAIARDGFPIIELVAQLRAHVGDEAAAWIHWGATTQDILDNALVVQLSTALQLIEHSLGEVIEAFGALAGRHRTTLMIGRTHLQPALPVTFGLEVATWLAPCLRHRQRLSEVKSRLRVIQCGGAAGTLASLGQHGPAVTRAWAHALGLGAPAMPWHAQRDNILATAQCLGLIGVSLSKFAQDVLLLTQAEIAEVQESADLARGGSSAMPQKRNPTTSETILVAAHSAAAHLAALHAAPPPEHQRGTRTLQVEFIHLPRLCALVGGALKEASRLASELVVDAPRMRANLDATQGVLLAEAATIALSAHLPMARARALVREACATASAEGRHLVDILRVGTSAPVAWDELRDEANYLGSTDDFITAVLAEVAALPKA